MSIQAKIIASLSALVLVLGLIGGLLYYRGEYNEKRAENEALSAEVTRLSDSLRQQAQYIAERADVSRQIADIERKFKDMEVEIGRNDIKLDRAIQKVKENDQAVRDYLSQPVPDSLGRLFVRPATTDPLLWRAPILESGAVQPGAVPTTRDPATSKQ